MSNKMKLQHYGLHAKTQSAIQFFFSRLDLAEYVAKFLPCSDCGNFFRCCKQLIVQKLHVLTRNCSDDQKAALWKICLSTQNILVIGGPGRGKSHILKLAMKFTHWANIQTHTCAYTALAAMGVDGWTIHRTFPLYMLHNNWNREEAKFSPGHHSCHYITDRIARLRKEIKYVILFIDEVSMVDATIQEQICWILQSKSSGTPVNCRFVAIGDFQQLPPIENNCINYSLSNNLRRYFFDHIGISSYEIFHLTTNHRQKEGPFSDILDSIGKGHFKQDEAKIQPFIKARLLAYHNLDDHAKQQITRLYFQNKDVFAWNKKCLEQISSPLQLIPIFFHSGRKVVKQTRCYKNQEVKYEVVPNLQAKSAAEVRLLLMRYAELKKILQSYRIEENVFVKIGCRIMITKNMYRVPLTLSIPTISDTTNNQEEEKEQSQRIVTAFTDLVNGQQGVLEEVQEKKGVVLRLLRSEQKVFVPYQSKIIEFCAGSEKYLVTVDYLPITLSYALTIHKSEGLTLDKAIVNISPSEHLSPNLVFVALSRCRKEEDLYLENFHVPTQPVDPRIEQFYENPHRYITEGFKINSKKNTTTTSTQKRKTAQAFIQEKLAKKRSKDEQERLNKRVKILPEKEKAQDENRFEFESFRKKMKSFGDGEG